MDADPPAASQAGANRQGNSCFLRYLETRFPLELFLHLTDFMEDTCLRNLRLACRNLENALLPIFQRRFFTKRHICLNERSLSRFSAISDEPRFGPQVSSISIGCVHSLSDNQGDDNALFIDCGYDVNILAHALSNTPGLQGVTINYAPFFSRVNTSHNVAAALARDNPRKLLRKLLRALSEAGRELQSFDVEHHGGTGGGFPLSDLYLGDSLFESLSRPLRSVKRLGLALDPNPDHTRQAKPNYIPDLVKFLKVPEKLERLRLNLDRDALHPASAILQRLTREAPSSFSHLTQLDLGKMTTTVATLTGFIDPVAKTLTKLQFFRIGLRFDFNDDYPPDLRDLKRPDDAPYVEAALWKMVFQKMAAMPELERLTKFYAGYLTERLRKDHVSFRLDSPGGGFEKGGPQCSHDGDDARAFLEELSDAAVIRVETRPMVAMADGTEEDDDDDSIVDSVEDDEEDTD